MYICIVNIQYYYTFYKSNNNTKSFMELKDNILKEIKKDYSLRRDLMNLHHVSEYTVLKWLRENSEELIKLSSLEIIADYLDEEIDNLISREKYPNIKTI